MMCFECARHLEREGRAAAADDGAGEPVDVLGCREQDRTGPDVGTDHVRVAELPLVDQPQQEPTHGPWGKQLSSALGLAEAREIDGDEAGVLGQARPDGVPREQALGPGIEEQDRLLRDRPRSRRT